MCRTIKILISNWPRTRKFSQLLQAGKTVAFDFAHHGHALVTFYFQFLCRWLVKIWQVSSCGKNLYSILNYFCVNLWCIWQSFSTGCTKWNSAAIRSRLLFMASWFLVENYVTCQSRKSDFRWHPFPFSPCFIRKGWKVWSDTGLTWYLSGVASRMVSLSNYCTWCLFFRSNLMKSSLVYAAI